LLNIGILNYASFYLSTNGVCFKAVKNKKVVSIANQTIHFLAFIDCLEESRFG
jgi:hypothetical protein